MTATIVPGSCLCETVRFEIELPTLACGHCHCSMCRRPHGASFVTWIAVPRERFRITAGAEDIVHYRSSEHGTRRFCRHCGSQMFCQTEPAIIDVTLASLHGQIDREPEAHWYYDSRAEWTRVSDDLPKLGGASGMEPLRD